MLLNYVEQEVRESRITISARFEIKNLFVCLLQINISVSLSLATILETNIISMDSEATDRERLASLTPSEISNGTASSGDELSESFQTHLQLNQPTFSLQSIAVMSPPTVIKEVKHTWASSLNPLPSINPLSQQSTTSSLISTETQFFSPELRTPPGDIQNPIETIGLRTAVIFQKACTNHTYIRTKDIASIMSIVERPERIRAIKTGVAAAWARLESKQILVGGKRWKNDLNSPEKVAGADLGELDELMSSLSSLGLQDSKGKGKAKEVLGGPFDIIFSTAILPVDDKALLYIHPLPNLPPVVEIIPYESPPSASPSHRQVPTTPKKNEVPLNESLSHTTWPSQLQQLCRDSTSAISSPPYSEIPSHLPQGDLYLSPGSEEAIFGALGAVCEGVDRIMEGVENGSIGYDRAFVAIRPPGHVRKSSQKRVTIQLTRLYLVSTAAKSNQWDSVSLIM